MKSFRGKLAILSGGSSGMGRSLVLALAKEGCSVAFCDLDPARILEVEKEANVFNVKVTGHVCDVSKEEDWLSFRDAAFAAHGNPGYVDILFCNAGIAGGWSMFSTSRVQWERTFNVNWLGVYLGARTFLPLLQKAPEAQIVNTASVNALHASLGPELPHTSYSAAKMAVRGFTEVRRALIGRVE
jgi:NAD(P)-dependent dehydrogenase (short-subunit alcohol dehydrogenase family)